LSINHSLWSGLMLGLAVPLHAGATATVCGQPILFVVRHQYKADHHNTETMFQTGEINTTSYQGGGALKVIDFKIDGGKTYDEE